MRRRTPFFRGRLAICCIVAGPLVLAVAGYVAPARGQVPGPESFAKEPQTPLELWDAVDYLVRTGQAKQAAPYLDKFLKSKPDDETLLRIRDRYGVGSILRLDDAPETRGHAEALTRMVTEATRRQAAQPGRIQRFVDLLTKSSDEQAYAVEQLREAGPYAIPSLLTAINRPGLPREERALLVYNMGRLGHSAVPPLIAALESTDARLVTDVAEALGWLGDARAVPYLTYLAAPGAGSPARESARRAIARLTGRAFESQPRSPVRVLVDEARRYHLHAVRFPSDPVLVWTWDDEQKVPVSRPMSRTDAEAFFGQRLAHKALRLDPSSQPAQVVVMSQALDKAVERAGFVPFLSGDRSGVFAAALAAGPDLLGQVLRTAIADGRLDLAAVAATGLGQVANRDLVTDGAGVHPLVQALSAPGRRVQLAAARALVLLDLRRPFAGSSQVVPTLARFITNQPAPRAVVIDGNVARGGRLAGALKALGYESTVASTGQEGFQAAAESADVELVLIDPHMVEGTWRLVDTLSNLRADARTAGIPIYVVGPLGHEEALDATFANFPGVRYLVGPTTPELLEKQLGGRPSGLSDAERAAYAREAATLLARIASQPGSPFESDLARVEPALAIALNTPTTALETSTAMGDVPDAGAQRGLADVVLEASKPAPLRLSAANQLSRSLQRFGPLVTADQEARFLQALDGEADPALRTALAAIVGALRPKPALTGQRLQQFNALMIPAAAPAQAAPAPESAPSPPAPETPPPAPAQAPAEAEAVPAPAPTEPRP